MLEMLEILQMVSDVIRELSKQLDNDKYCLDHEERLEKLDKINESIQKIKEVLGDSE